MRIQCPVCQTFSDVHVKGFRGSDRVSLEVCEDCTATTEHGIDRAVSLMREGRGLLQDASALFATFRSLLPARRRPKEPRVLDITQEDDNNHGDPT